MESSAAKEALLDSMRREGLLTDEIEKAFRAVPRERFVPPEFRKHSYADAAIHLTEGATVSQPSMLAQVLSCLDLYPGCRVLEIGSGSGYLLALLHAMGASVTGVEIIPELAARSEEMLAELGIECDVHRMSGDDAQKLGKFDRVLFSAAIQSIPAWSHEVLNDDGFLLAPVGGPAEQELIIVSKKTTVRTGKYCRFVPYANP